MDPWGHNVRELAAIAKVSLRTARRWKAKGLVPAPYAARVALILDTDLGQLSPLWDGWRIRRGELVSPEGLRLVPQQLRALPLQVEALQAFRTEHKKSRAERDTARDLTNAARDLNEALRSAISAIETLHSLLSPSNRRDHRATQSGVTLIA